MDKIVSSVTVYNFFRHEAKCVDLSEQVRININNSEKKNILFLEYKFLRKWRMVLPKVRITTTLMSNKCMTPSYDSDKLCTFTSNPDNMNSILRQYKRKATIKFFVLRKPRSILQLERYA